MYQRNKTIGIILLAVAAIVAVVTMVLAFFIVPTQWEDSDLQVQSRTPLLIIMGGMYVLMGVTSVAAFRHPMGIGRGEKSHARFGGRLTSKWTLMRVNGKIQMVNARRLRDPEGYGLIVLGVTMIGITMLLLSLAVLSFIPAWSTLCQVLSVVVVLIMLFVVNWICKRHYTIDQG